MTAVKVLVKWPCDINMEKFHCIFFLSASSQVFVGFFNYSFLEIWVVWLTWFYVLDVVGLLLKPL